MKKKKKKKKNSAVVRNPNKRSIHSSACTTHTFHQPQERTTHGRELAKEQIPSYIPHCDLKLMVLTEWTKTNKTNT